ncbi:hypothetical protein CPB85DRAFT_1159629, partial [Mucidula mucida]
PPTYLTAPEAGKNAFWTINCCKLLLEFLTPRIPAAGDNNKFKTVDLNAAAAFLNEHCVRGGPKTQKSVNNKLSDLQKIASAVEYLSEVSGMTYTEEYGLNIVTSTESVIWDGIV